MQLRIWTGEWHGNGKRGKTAVATVRYYRDNGNYTVSQKVPTLHLQP